MNTLPGCLVIEEFGVIVRRVVGPCLSKYCHNMCIPEKAIMAVRLASSYSSITM